MELGKSEGKRLNLIIILAGVFALALFVRSYFVYDLALKDFLLSGGSDAYYYGWIIEHIVKTGKHLVSDPMLNFPIGMNNPRPPIYAWSVALTGILVGALQGSTQLGVWQTFLFSTAFWGALTIFPTYFLARDIFGRRTGMVAAFFLAILPAHIQRTPLSNGDHDALVLFFVVTAFYFFLRALSELKEKKWVESWFRPRAVYGGLKTLIVENKRPILLSIMSGTSIAVVALTWQGWAYAPVVLIAYFLVQLLVYKVRNQDPLGIILCFTVAMGTAHLLAAPYYISTGFVRTWFDIPLLLFLAAAGLGILFAFFYRLPWMLVIPPIVLGFSGGLAIASIYSPTVAETISTGMGYFVRDKVYETIAEAQPPTFSQAMLSFGWVTSFLSIVGIGGMAIQYARRPRPGYLFALAWIAAAIFMAMSAVRFIFNASPAFAITSAWVTVFIVEKLGFEQVRKAIASTGGSKLTALRKGVKVRHVAGALFIAFFLILPNTWTAVDAAVPFEKKQALDLEIYRSIPEPLRPPTYEEGSLFYFGAFGYNLPLKTRYFPKAWEWLSQQDSSVHPYWNRPAFLSWWDYGFEAIQEGRHPTVADNFQNGYEFAGHFLTAQDENEAIAVLNIRLIQGELWKRGELGEAVRDALEARGIDAGLVHDVLGRPAVYIPLIRADPERFGEWDVRISGINAMIIFLKAVLTEALDVDGQADLYRDLRTATGNSVLYFAVDSRLVPFSGTNTGILYAPVKLTDHRVTELPGGRVIPTDFYRLLADTDQGQFDMDKVPPTARIRNVLIEYQQMFYDSMLYRIFFGLRGSDVGIENEGLPGLSGALQGEIPLQGFLLKHFKMVYRTAYFNPYPPEEVANRTEDWTAINLFDALEIQERIQRGEAEGTVDVTPIASLLQGIVILKYYDGAILRGKVTTEDGKPLAGVMITVQDELRIVHDVVTTDANGHYEAIAPFGSVRVVASVGSLDSRSRIGSDILGERTINITEEQAARLPTDLDGNGRPDYIVDLSFEVKGSSLTGSAYLDLDASSTKGEGEEGPAGLQVNIQHVGTGTSTLVLTESGGGYETVDLLPGSYRITVSREGSVVAETTTSLRLGQIRILDIPVSVSKLSGLVVDEFGTPADGGLVQLVEEATGLQKTVTVNEEGEYLFEDLFAGNYTLDATLGERGSFREKLIIAANSTTTRDMVVRPMAEISGRSFLSFRPTPFITITLHSKGMGTAVTVTTNASGDFSTTIPEGTYYAYSLHFQGGRGYSFLGTLSVEGGEVRKWDVNLEAALRVQGRVTKQDGAGVAGVPVTFEFQGTPFTASSDAEGSFLVYLPAGSYRVWAYDREGLYVSSITLAGSTTLNLPLAAGVPVVGRLFYDLNENGTWDFGEELEGVRIDLVDSDGRRLSVLTGQEGRYEVPLFRDLNYTLVVNERGFLPLQLGPLNPIELSNRALIEMRPEPIRVGGSLATSEGLDLQGVSVLFEPVGQGASLVATTADEEGSFSAEVLPGLYRVVVDAIVGGNEAVRLQNLEEKELRVPLGKVPKAFQMEVVKRVKVEGQLAVAPGPFEGELQFTGPEEVSVSVKGSFSTYLRPGWYTMYATSDVQGRRYTLLTLTNISSPLDLNSTLVEAATLTGTVRVAERIVTRSIPLSFLRDDGAWLNLSTDPSGSYVAALTSGNYIVSLDWRGVDEVDGPPRYVRYSVSQPFALSTGETKQLVLRVSRTLDNATLSGVVLLSGQPVSARVTFEAANVTAMNAATEAIGPFEVSLAPGVYNVYVFRETGKSVNLTRLEVVPYAGNEVSLRLVAGYRVSGVISLEDGSKGKATMGFAREAVANFTTDESGRFEAYLPAGQYSVQARAQRLERGVTVDYATSTLLSLGESTVLNLQLARLRVATVEVEWDASQRGSVAPGGTLVYSVRVRNTGNVEDSFRFAGSPLEWIFDFEPRVVTLPFGQGGLADVTVSITAPETAKVQHDPIFIEVTSTSNATVRDLAVVEIDVLQVRDIALRLAVQPPAMSPEALEYRVDLTNRGNGDDTYTLILVNPQTLATQGWRARLEYQGQTYQEKVEDIRLSADSTGQVTLRLEPVGRVSTTKAILVAYSQQQRDIESLLEVQLSFPSLALPEGDVSLEGKNLRLGPPEFPLYLYGTMAAAAAIVAILLIMRYRRRRRRR